MISYEFDIYFEHLKKTRHKLNVENRTMLKPCNSWNNKNHSQNTRSLGPIHAFLQVLS